MVIIPAELVVGRGSIALYPKYRRSKYREYKEAWHLLRPSHAEGCVVDRIEACADSGPGLGRGVGEWLRGLFFD